MDNKEAIKELSEWLDGCCGGEEIEPTRQALRLAISALQAQDSPKPTAGSVQNVQNEDLISRKAAIDAFMTSTSDGDKADWCKWVLEQLPSAFVKDTNVPCKDTISRQEAIDALAYFDEKSPTGKTAQDIIISLPPAQPEIVRCKDCKYRGGLSGFYCDIVEKAVGVDSFCSWAERRTDEGD